MKNKKIHFIIVNLIVMITLSACSKSKQVDNFLSDYKNVVIKWEEKKKVDSIKNFVDQINKDNEDLCKKSKELKEKYPVEKWDKSQVERFQNLAQQFMFIRLDAGYVDYTPNPAY